MVHSSIDSPTTIPNGSSSRLYSWILPVLMLALVTLSGYSVTQGWDGDTSWRFSAVAFIAGVVSLLLAHSRILDGFAILLALLSGVGVIWLLTASFSDYLTGSAWERVQAYPEPVIEALFLDRVSSANRELTADTLLSLTIWMSSWIAIWMLFRVGYLVLALIAPSVLILASQHFNDGGNNWVIVAMVALCVVIIVCQRFTASNRRWQALRVPVADSLISRTLITGLAIAVVVSSTVMASPQAWTQTVLQPMIERTVESLESLRLEAQVWFDDLLGTSTAPPRAGSFTDFSDGFQIGGPLTLTDQPEVLVRVDSQSAPYLKARTYDHYSGRGWSSSSNGAFVEESESVRTSAELRYNPNWEIAVSAEARNERDHVTASISPLTPASNTVLSVDSFLSADVQTVVRMSWTTVVEQPMPLRIDTLGQLPPDVQKLGSFLLQSELSGNRTAWGPGATSGEMQEAIDEEVDDLARRGIEVYWTASDDGIVDTLYVTGRLPVFDDVEAVFRYQTSDLVSPDYQSTGLTSVATSEQLTNASTEYPDWVTDRYLQTSDTVTDRTLQLTQDIVGEETNPYLQAVLIEGWLRNNITYDESVEAPPGDQDLVDYVLFDHRYGYCEHYAASMTVMLRSLGVPARVVVGYSPGEWDSETNSFLYRQSNAHAWVEVYFPGYGWVPFEPTANRPLGEFDLETTGEEFDLANPEQELIAPTEVPEPTASISTPDVEQDNSLATPVPTSDDELLQPPVIIESDQSGGVPGWMIAIGLAATGVAAILGGIWLLWNRSLRGLLPAAGLMRRLQRVGTWLGVRSGPTTTPREYQRRLDSSMPAVSAPAKRITRAYEVETYGPKMARDQMMEDAKRAWGDIRRMWFRLLRRK